MNKRGLVIGLLVMLAVITSGFTYAFWADSIDGNNKTSVGTISIGEGGAVTTTVSVDDFGFEDLDLVPTAYATTPGGAEGEDYVTLTFSVLWDGDGAEGATGTLAVTHVFSGLGSLDNTAIEVMFSVVPVSGQGAIVAGTAQDVVLKVIFDTEPANQSIYNDVANGTLAITFTFTVTP